jgi:hypothetical protein
MPSQDYMNFIESCFGNPLEFVYNGINEKAILSLQGEEKNEAERILLKALETNGDPYYRPVIALGLLCSKLAIEPLKRHLNKAIGIDRIQTALALFRIMKYPEAEEVIIDCLVIADNNNPDISTRDLAVRILPFIGKTPQVIQALLDVLSEDNLIGYSAAGSLRSFYIDDEPIRNLMGQILLIPHDIHKPDFVNRPILVKQAIELIGGRLHE